MERAATSSVMSSSQQSAGAARALAAGEALTLRPRGTSVLRVTGGRLWLTASGTTGHAPQDVFLRCGEQLTLCAGQEVVLEGWPAARFELAPAPQAVTALGLLQGLTRLVRAVSASRPSAAPAPRACS
nr:DUF2917 domain-containing protein [uncultured Caldimonas sp.]